MLYNLFYVIALVLLSGTFAGLTLALFSLNLSTLEHKSHLGDLRAKRVFNIRKRGNLLLCTLLLGNAASYTFMPIFLSQMTSGIVAGTIATVLILVFGEILPQAVFPRYALWLGSKFYWFIKILLILFYPIAAPISWVLDRVLGTEPPLLWSKQELQEIIKFHEDEGDGIIDKDEERIILGALTFSEIPVSDIMIPAQNVFTLNMNAKINQELLESIKSKGFSKIPVYDDKDSIVGILFLKNLIGVKPSRKSSVKKFSTYSNLIIVKKFKKLDDVFNLMIKQKTYISIVVNSQRKFLGIVTLEDIMKKIVNTNFEDHKK